MFNILYPAALILLFLILSLSRAFSEPRQKRIVKKMCADAYIAQRKKSMNKLRETDIDFDNKNSSYHKAFWIKKGYTEEESIHKLCVAPHNLHTIFMKFF